MTENYEKELKKEIKEYEEKQRNGIHFREEINGDGGLSMVWLIDITKAKLKGYQKAKEHFLKMMKEIGNIHCSYYEKWRVLKKELESNFIERKGGKSEK